MKGLSKPFDQSAKENGYALCAHKEAVTWRANLSRL